MKSLINLNRITKISYMIGITCLVVGIMFSFVTQTGEAATANNSKCGSDYTYKDESAPFEYKGDKIIDKVIIKAGDRCIKLRSGNSSSDCYKATGLGTKSVKVKRIGEENPSCQEISHVLFFGDDPKPPTTEPPPATTEPPPTEVTPTEPTPTDPTPTDPTPTDPTPTEPTPTEATPTEPTPTEPTPTDPTPTDPTPTESTPTEPTDSPETATPTEPPETPKETDPPKEKTPDPTDPPEKKKTPTPPPTLAQPTPMEGTPQVLIPQTGVDLSASNQIFGSQFFLLLGLTFIGFGMITQGFSKRRTQNDTQD